MLKVKGGGISLSEPPVFEAWVSQLGRGAEDCGETDGSYPCCIRPPPFLLGALGGVRKVRFQSFNTWFDRLHVVFGNPACDKQTCAQTADLSPAVACSSRVHRWYVMQPHQVSHTHLATRSETPTHIICSYHSRSQVVLSGLWRPGTEFDYGGQLVPEDELNAILAGNGSIASAVSPVVLER